MAKMPRTNAKSKKTLHGRTRKYTNRVYKTCGDAIGVDLINAPELLLEPKNAVMSAGWFWNKRGLNALADNQDWETITKRINGGTLGLQDRIDKTHKAMDILGA